MTDWTTEAADTVERVVSTVRDRAVVPVQKATRAVVFGLLAAFLVVPALAFSVIGGFRLVDNYLPGKVWSAWLLFGGIFVAVGAFVWHKRNP